jgi:exosortase H (IPTLxxWG-CTERM-specific)
MKLAAVLERQRDGIRFCVLFAAFTLLSFTILYLSQNAIVVPVNRHFAWISEKVLRLVGVHAASSGPILTLSTFAVEIGSNCNAIYEVGLYTAAVWAYPAPWRQRLVGTLVGATVLYVVNVLRIGTLLVVGLVQPSWFETTHLYVWQTLFLLVVATCWIAWVSRLRPVA